MEADADGIAEKVQSLSDLELAVLICLIAEQHCVIECEVEGLRGVQVELELVSVPHLHVSGKSVERRNV